MSKTVKAALLSGLVMPGAGHLYLKKYPQGFALMIFALGCLAVLLVTITRQALTVVEKLQAEGGVISADRIVELTNQVAASSDGYTSSMSFYLLVACWLVALVDACRLGAKAKSSTTAAAPQPE